MPGTKIRYEVDPFNRLVKDTAGLRRVLDGEFKIGRGNSLSYLVKSSLGSGAPQELKLRGKWSLNKEHNLVFTLDKENTQVSGSKLTLRGEIIQARADKIEFSISSRDSNGQAHLYLLSLSGVWQADKYNRLKFLAQRKQEAFDELTLSSTWEVNRRNELTYTYIKERLKTKEKSRHQLTFAGYWEITRKLRLIYQLDKTLGSYFDFSASLAEPLPRGLRYEIGVGLRPKTKKITLFGSWRLNPRVGLEFEMPTEQGKIRAIVFGANVRLAPGRLLELKLKNSLNQPLGLTLKLSQTLFKDQGEAFIQALKEGKEISLRAGLGFRW
jgi:hypothetical protein